MANDFKVKARLEAEDAATPTVQRVSGSFERLGSYLASKFTITLGDVRNAVKDVVGVFGSMVSEAAEAERASKALDAALSGLGSGAGAIAEGLRAQAAALQDTTRFSDDAIVAGQALLATYTQNEEQLRRSTQAAVDFAAATGTDLQSSFELLAKAAAGSTAALSRYGIILDENIPAAEKFEAVLAKMSDQFGGRAAADVQTFSGALDQLKNSYADLQEQAGKAVTENERVRQAMQDLNSTLRSEGVIDSVSALSNGLVEFSAQLSNVVLQRISEYSLGLRAMFGDQKAAAIYAQQMRDAFADAAKSTAELTEETQRLVPALSATTSLMERNARTERENADATKGFADAVHALGVTLEADVNTTLSRNTALMEQAEELYRRALISREDFERVERAVAEANREATDSLYDQVDAFDSLSGAADSSSESFDGFRRSVSATRSELDSFSDASRKAAEQQAKFATNTITGGKSSFAQLKGGTFTAAPGTTYYYDSNYNLRVRA